MPNIPNAAVTRRTVSAHLEADVTAVAEVVLSLALAAGSDADETLSITVDGQPVAAEVVEAVHGTRLHVVRDVPVGRLVVDYAAVLTGALAPTVAGTDGDAAERITYLRPSRYCESDTLAAVAGAEFGGLAGKDLLDAVSSWVGHAVVRRVEVEPAAVRQRHGRPRVRRVGPPQLRTPGGRLGLEVAADVARRQSPHAQCAGHQVGEILAHAAPLRHHLRQRGVDLGARAVIGEAGVDAMHQLQRRLGQRPARRQAGRRKFAQDPQPRHVGRGHGEFDLGPERRASHIAQALRHLVPGSGHVRLAVGRDYADVTPLRGVIRGGGGSHTLDVAVRTRVVEAAADAAPEAGPRLAIVHSQES